MFALDLFNTDHERRIAEGAVDQLEQRRIDDLAMKMDDLVARAKNPAYKKNPAALAALMKEFQKCKAERDSYYMIRNETMGHGSLGEAKADYNFNAEDLKRLERIRDLATLKTQALELISRPSAKPMKPEKVEWFKNALEKMNSPLKVIKLMYDLLLSGEGHAVVGSKSSMNPNSYRQRFGEQETDEAGIPGNVPVEKIPGKEDLLKGRGRSYYEADQKKNSDQFEGYQDSSDSPVAGAITRRILSQRLDLLKQYGPELVGAAVDNVADYVGDVDEIGSSDVSGWVMQVERMLKENPPEAFDEGWSDAVVARRTGQPRTPYSVYIKGKKWKDFENDDHAEAVANKLRAKFKAEGRDTSVITIAPTDYDKDLKETDIDEGQTDYSKRRQRERDVDAGKPVAKQRPSKMTDYQKRRAQQKREMELGESHDDSGVEQAILHRIMVAHTDLLKQFGPQKVMQAAEEVAYNVGDVDEIGTSDVSAYVAQVKQILGA